MSSVHTLPTVAGRAHLELEAAGWQRRFEADVTRAAELVDLYSELSYEVTTAPIEPEEFGPDCTGCAIVASCQRYVAVYTRGPQEVPVDQ
jgi:hypothetical protein